MRHKPENITRQTLLFLQPLSLIPSVIGWVILLASPLAHLVLPKDWERDLFVWVGIPLEPKIVLLGGYAVMFGAILLLIAAAIFLSRNPKYSVMGETPIISFATFVAIVAIVAIGACGIAGLHMIEISQKFLAAILFTLPMIILVIGLWVSRR